jgi:hypothetical protein
MAQFGASIQTAQVTTGNFRTAVDPYQSNIAKYTGLQNGARNPLGAAYYDNTPLTGTTANASFAKYRYVQYVSASAPALTGATGCFPVYWQNSTYTAVTPVYTEGFTGGINNLAGYAMPNLTSLSSYTGATLATLLANAFIWICVGGYLTGVSTGVTGQAANSAVIGSTTTLLNGFVANGTAPTNRIGGFTTAAAATTGSFLFNMLVTLES